MVFAQCFFRRSVVESDGDLQQRAFFLDLHSQKEEISIFRAAVLRLGANAHNTIDFK